jgi:hypothetical protein
VSSRSEELASAISHLDRWGRERDWIGSDPYEGLNARRPRLAKRHALGRRLLIQAVKRSPLDPRRALGIEPRDNAAALGHLLSAYSRIGGASDAERRETLGALVARLGELRSAEFPEPCWGYPFDVETRFFFYAATTPNTIATAFAALGLLDAHAATGDERALELAAGAAEFFRARVPQTESEAGAYFGYLPGDRTPIHNANLLACRVLARVAESTADATLRSPVQAGVEFALAGQRADGSWPYSELPGQGWVDGFHTGYVLDSLMSCRETLEEPRLDAAIARGLGFYASELVQSDGTPKYTSDGVWPVDGQCAAQAIATFSRAAGRDPGLLDLAWSVFGFAQRRLRRPDGSYRFQRRRLWANSIPHVRWVQAPMLDGLTLLARAEADR